MNRHTITPGFIRHSTLGFRNSPRLAPRGMAGLNAVRQDLANGSMSSNQSGGCNARSARRQWTTDSLGLGSQRDIRRAFIEADLVDCMVALPGQLFMAMEKFNLALAA